MSAPNEVPEENPVAHAHIRHLPASTSGLTRKSLAHKSLIDHVDDLFGKLYDSSAEFRALQEAIFDSEAVQGSMQADDYVGAQMIQAFAADDHPVNVKPNGDKVLLEPVMRALKRARTRWGISRKGRRDYLQAIEGQ